ncbi:hypothetical protein MHB44_00510 [Lysinibacillus sp. FSL H8-0500]|uniref:Uncharacterized protein n=1 Tax=Lysinibacillus macroides TaxID=33935 RepID=A0A0M9DGK1_9BACI|nr:hypothetical protein [Lysinibacillus macroides]KOY79920.1 hypothetical protein ADM90_22145 [Lysinibacillus macroides]QPR67171.1 hypothetical protein I6G82_18325 [Lysinibacillus macroides]
MNQLTKAALICGSGSMIILVSILIRLPFFVQILLLLSGLAISVYGVFLLVKMAIHPTESTRKTPSHQTTTTPPNKKKKPSSTL